MKYYIYPDGTISEEPLDFMSDDYYVLQAQDDAEVARTCAAAIRARNSENI